MLPPEEANETENPEDGDEDQEKNSHYCPPIVPECETSQAIATDGTADVVGALLCQLCGHKFFIETEQHSGGARNVFCYQR